MCGKEVARWRRVFAVALLLVVRQRSCSSSPCIEDAARHLVYLRWRMYHEQACRCRERRLTRLKLVQLACAEAPRVMTSHLGRRLLDITNTQVNGKDGRSSLSTSRARRDNGVVSRNIRSASSHAQTAIPTDDQFADHCCPCCCVHYGLSPFCVRTHKHPCGEGKRQEVQGSRQRRRGTKSAE